MADPVDRAAVKALLVDILALRLADNLNAHKLPDKKAFDTYRAHVGEKAETILSNYDRELQVDQISSEVVEKVGTALSRRSRVFAILEIATNVAAVLIGFLASSVALFFDPVTNRNAIMAVCFVITGTLLVQFIMNLYFRHFDSKSGTAG